jgi:predicted lipoprotein with Yx(FWY)xxD motif
VSEEKQSERGVSNHPAAIQEMEATDMNTKVLSRGCRSALIVTAVAVAAIAAGCGGSMSSSPTSSNGVAETTHTTLALVTTRTIPGLGTVLVNNRGFTLYTFARDQRKRVTCTGSCASFWPPLKLMGVQKPTAGGAAQTSKLASDKDPAGGNVVTYAGWPLYTYTADTAPGEAKGQGLNLNGGVWHVISPASMVIMSKPDSGSGSNSGTTTSGAGAGGDTTTSGGGGGWG